MRWFLLWFLGSAGALVVAACIVVLFIRHRFNRHHRVDPKIPTDAPLTWAVDPRTIARLHRRLAKVGSAATTVEADHPPNGRLRRREESPVAITARDLRARAVALDDQLARLSVLTPGARRGSLDRVARATTELEAAAAQLVAYSTELQVPRQLVTDDPTIVDIRGQLERLTEAHRELVALEADAGLVNADAVTRTDGGRPDDADLDVTRPTSGPTDGPSPGR